MSNESMPSRSCERVEFSGADNTGANVAICVCREGHIARILCPSEPGLRGTGLIQGAVAPGATRTTAPAIETYCRT